MTSIPGNGGRNGESEPATRTDIRVTLIIIAVALALWLETTTFESVPTLLAQNIPPEFFPRLVLATIVVLALVLPFEPLILKRHGGAKRKTAPLPAMTWMTAALLVAVAASTAWVGTLASMVLACLLLPALWGERRAMRVIPFALLFPGAVALVFSGLLKVPFEPGLMTTLLGAN